MYVKKIWGLLVVELKRVPDDREKRRYYEKPTLDLNTEKKRFISKIFNK